MSNTGDGIIWPVDGLRNYFGRTEKGQAVIQLPAIELSAPLVASPTAGLWEFDGTVAYFTPSAGARGVADCISYCALNADYTLTDVNTAQKAFNASTNGAITVPSSTCYMIDAAYYITNTGTTAHTWAVLLGGTATFTAAGTLLTVDAYTATGNNLTSKSAIYISGAAVSSATVVTSSSTSATENVHVRISGRLNVNAGGTIIPQVQLSAATTGTEKMLAGSYFSMWPVGSNTNTTVGNWS